MCITVPGLWTGNTSTAWNISTSWDDSNLPSMSTNVRIPTIPDGGNFPETNNGANAECNNLLIETGAHLYIPFNTDTSIVVEYYHTGEQREQFAGQADLIVAKQRNGPVGDTDLLWHKEYTRFVNPARKAYDEFEQFGAGEAF